MALLEGSLSVFYFLTPMEQVQERYPVNEMKLFGKTSFSSHWGAHEFIMNWISNRENVSTVYHKLLVNMTKRVPPDKAIWQLAQFLTARNSSLARAESQIMILAGMTSIALPAGQSGTAYFNFEAYHALNTRVYFSFISQIVTFVQSFLVPAWPGRHFCSAI